jgi:AraC family transcriptional regulator of adaptative response/methylated-DNA-[protein]-cysteine methyltransferase
MTKGDDFMLQATIVKGSLGTVLIAGSTRGVCALFLGDDPDVLWAELRRRFADATTAAADPAFVALANRVAAAVDRGTPWPSDVALDLRGTDFQRRVWRALQMIPAGSTATYAEIARRIGAPRAVRAVGTACGQNPISIGVPCHRALRSDGGLGGYRWGLPRKRLLLEREQTAAGRRAHSWASAATG